MSLVQHLLRHRAWGVGRDDVVVDLGSGGDPIFRANILVDKYLTSDFQRYSRAVVNRPTICADGSRLPFGDKTVDFVYCSHVIEHIPNPGEFLKEIERVGKRGLIEAPNGNYEKLHPRELHLWYVYSENGALRLVQKRTWNEFPELAGVYSRLRKSTPRYYDYVAKNWRDVNTVHFWSGRIDHTVEFNDDYSEKNFARVTREDQQPPRAEAAYPVRSRLKSLLHRAAFRMLAAHHDVFEILRCPRCMGRVNSGSGGSLVCGSCSEEFIRERNVVFMDVTAPNYGFPEKGGA